MSAEKAGPRRSVKSPAAQPGAPVGYLREGLVDPRFRGHRLLEHMLAFVQRRTTEQAGSGMPRRSSTMSCRR